MINKHLRVVSFNCKHVVSSIPEIRELCDLYDVIALQETWLQDYDLNQLSLIDNRFYAKGISAMDTSTGVMRGRPYGGLAILWKKSLGSACKPIVYDSETRIMGLEVSSHEAQYLFLNVYLPCCSHENSEDFSQYLSLIDGLVTASGTPHVCILGDFNADTTKSHLFGDELTKFLHEESYILSDVVLSDKDSFTFTSDAQTTRSWIDHCMTTKSLHSLIQSVKIHYEMVSSDHFPLGLALKLNIPHSQPTRCGSERGKRIKWSQLSEAERDNYKLSTEKKLSRIRLDLSVLMCEDTTCSNPSHLAWIESFYNETVKALLDAGLEFAESTSGKTPIIPGWNEMCAEIHTQARNCFLQWRSAGSPKSGPMYDNMRISKAHFKLNLRNCKADKDRAVADSLANNLLGKDSRTFWKEIQQIAGNKNSCPAQTIDGITGSQESCNMWKGHFTSLLNSCRDFSKRESVEKRVAVVTYVDRYKPDDVANATKELKRNKSPGADMLTSEHFLYASEKLHVLLSLLFNCVNIHGYLPSRLMETIIVPIVKDNKGILTDKNNYRPIALTCVASKLLELLILDICSDTITTTDSQFGFKENHSTDMCIFTLKETVQYYVSLGSPVYLCFMDASKAFDKVNHWHLFDKLLNCGVPVYVSEDVVILAYVSRFYCKME